MEFTKSAILDTLYSLIFPEDDENDQRKGNDQKKQKKSDDAANIEKGTAHLFQETAFTIPTYCNYCKEYIWGFTQQGYTCSVCGYAIHAKCISKVPPNCRPKLSKLIKENLEEIARHDQTEESSNTLTITTARSMEVDDSSHNDSHEHHRHHRRSSSIGKVRQQGFFFKHHFVEGNLPLGVDCDVCEDSFEIFGSNGWRCSRCEKMVHDSCKEYIERQECTPRHKNLLYVPLDIQHHYPDQFVDSTPLIVFVNSRSGGQYGGVLIHEFTKLLDRHQVFDLNVDKGPERGLRKYLGVPRLKILVSGGDGTVGWVLSSLDKLLRESAASNNNNNNNSDKTENDSESNNNITIDDNNQEKVTSYDTPPVAILPLGTGNDLARTLGWGTGYSGEELSPLLDSIEDAQIVQLDRWRVTFSRGTTKEGIMNNYMSVGVDAEVALEFHNLRNTQPELFTSQFVNKFWYANYGLKCMFSDIDELGQMVDIEVDGQRITLPRGVGGIMILNLPSYAGGANLWGEGEDITGKYQPQAIDDKLLEIVAITGSFHMGTIQVNLSQAIRIAQGSSIRLKLRQKLPVQVDGEPWMQDPSEIQVDFWNKAKMMYQPASENRVYHSLHGNNTEEKVARLEAENKTLKAENHALRSQLEEVQRQLFEAKQFKESHK